MKTVLRGKFMAPYACIKKSEPPKKLLRKIQHPFILKSSGKKTLRMEGKKSQHNKSYIWKVYIQRSIKQGKPQSISTKFRNKPGVSLFPLLRTEHLSGRIRQESKYLYLLMLWFYVWDPKDYTRKYLELINIFSKMTSYKINK